MRMNDSVISNKALAALRIREGELPITISALETRVGPKSTNALREMATRTYEARKKDGFIGSISDADSRSARRRGRRRRGKRLGV